jgi:hypothetical protein
MVLAGIKSVDLFGLAGLPLNFVSAKQVMLPLFCIAKQVPD